MLKKYFYALFTHPKSVPRQSPFYAGLQAVDLRSSPATSSIMRMEKTLINSMFSLFFVRWNLYVHVCTIQSTLRQCRSHDCGGIGCGRYTP